jgi:hypothetical protein
VTFENSYNLIEAEDITLISWYGSLQNASIDQGAEHNRLRVNDTKGWIGFLNNEDEIRYFQI